MGCWGGIFGVRGLLIVLVLCGATIRKVLIIEKQKYEMKLFFQRILIARERVGGYFLRLLPGTPNNSRKLNHLSPIQYFHTRQWLLQPLDPQEDFSPTL